MPKDGQTERADYWTERDKSERRINDVQERKLNSHNELTHKVEMKKAEFLEIKTRGSITKLLNQQQDLPEEELKETLEIALSNFAELMKDKYSDEQYPKKVISLPKGNSRTEYPIYQYGAVAIINRIKEVYGKELSLEAEDSNIETKLTELLEAIHQPVTHIDELEGMEEVIKSEREYLNEFQLEGEIPNSKEIKKQMKQYYEERFGQDMPENTAVAVSDYDTLLQAISLNQIIELRRKLELEKETIE